MNRIAKFAASSLLAVATGAALAAGSPGVEHNTQAFLEALAAAGGKPLETLSPADARAVLAGAQAAPKVPLPPADVSEKTINVDGKPIRLTIVRRRAPKANCPPSCSSMAAAGSWATSPRMSASCATSWPTPARWRCS